MKVILTVGTVGQYFATCGVVRDARTKKVLHETRDYPYGFTGNALDAAEKWAKANGHQIANEDR